MNEPRLHLPLPESAGINGYHYIDGTSMRCVGCGRFLGTLCVAIEEGYTPPVVILPYDEGACPVCNCFEALIDTWENPHTGSPNAWPKGKPRPLP